MSYKNDQTCWKRSFIIFVTISLTTYTGSREQGWKREFPLDPSFPWPHHYRPKKISLLSLYWLQPDLKCPKRNKDSRPGQAQPAGDGHLGGRLLQNCASLLSSRAKEAEHLSRCRSVKNRKEEKHPCHLLVLGAQPQQITATCLT